MYNSKNIITSKSYCRINFYLTQGGAGPDGKQGERGPNGQQGTRGEPGDPGSPGLAVS